MATEVDANAKCIAMDLMWSDGMTHKFIRNVDDSWTLRVLTGVPEPMPRITGYKRKDMDRVIGRSLMGTLDDRNHDEEPVDEEIPLTREAARTLWKAIHGDHFTPSDLDKALKELHDHGIGDL